VPWWYTASSVALEWVAKTVRLKEEGFRHREDTFPYALSTFLLETISLPKPLDILPGGPGGLQFGHLKIYKHMGSYISP
jgi:hypothetical protein